MANYHHKSINMFINSRTAFNDSKFQEIESVYWLKKCYRKKNVIFINIFAHAVKNVRLSAFGAICQVP